MVYGLYKLLVYAFIGYLIYAALRFLGKAGAPKKTMSPPRQISGTMVKDEVCNTYLPKEEAIRDVIDGKEVYFCSKECRGKYNKR
jgi:uncharacterized protein